MEQETEQKKKAAETLRTMIELLGLKIDIIESDDQDAFRLSLKTEDTGRLIGRKGHYLQSLELILNRVMRKQYNHCPWVELDVDGYQRKHRPGRRGPEDTEGVEKIAQEAAAEVKRWGQPKTIGPFNTDQRRVVHMVLGDDDGVEAESAESSDQRGGKRITIRLVE